MREQKPADVLFENSSGLPAGVKLLRTLEGHKEEIRRLAWSPDGRMIASASEDHTVGIWDAWSGELVRTLGGYESGVASVRFSPKGGLLASCSGRVIDICDTSSGDLIFSHKGNSEYYSLAFNSSGQILVSGSIDSLEFFEASASGWRMGGSRRNIQFGSTPTPINSVEFKGRLLVSGGGAGAMLWKRAHGDFRMLWKPGRSSGGQYCVTFDPSGGRIASGAGSDIHIYDLPGQKLLRTLEGHTGIVDDLGFSPQGQLLASKSNDETVRIWRCDTWETVAVLPEEKLRDMWLPGLAFNPRLPLLATIGCSAGNLESNVIHIWELDIDILLSRVTAPVISLTSAKVVLVGESNVGKSYLAHRIATGLPPKEGVIKSTHGMKFWPLEPERLSIAASSPSGERREVVLWDMGGQEEYRLIHQLFLHDTTLALVLLDPTRGATAFKEVETWNKYLDKQLRGRAAVKLLVGTKLDQPSNAIVSKDLECLCNGCGFAGYFETSALSGRGIAELCSAAADAIDWDGLGQTSRPELFQRIRDEIESRRKRGEVVLYVADLHRFLSDGQSPAAKQEEKAIDAVTGQLATQGVIARSRVSTGEPVLVLQVQEIERYAGSLIIAAKRNPRGVPALELRAIAQKDFLLPGIPESERLPRSQEKPVLECTVQLMLEHGICFQHVGLLVFPSLFAPAQETDTGIPHAVSLYYDFAGAIDNIYASLVAWLVLARDFGRVRLWSDRAEFEVKDGGLCGLRKVARPGGFAHVDVYFEAKTPENRRKEFISFVEEHLQQNGVEIRERLMVPCPKNFVFDEETLRIRIAEGAQDVLCPRCEERHSLVEGAADARKRDPKIVQKTWALKTEIEKRRQESTERAVQLLEREATTQPAAGPIRVLHLSDLHFTSATPIPARLQWLLDDLKRDSGLGVAKLDYLVVSGDFTDKGSQAGFEKAYEFVSGLTEEFGLSAERCIFVPGNHDVVDLQESYRWKNKVDGLKGEEWVRQGEIFLVRDPDKYPLRFKPFSDGLFHKFLQRPYPTDYAEQAVSIPFWETRIQFLALNSCWQIDQFYRKRSGIREEAVAHCIKEAQKQEREARSTGQLGPDQSVLRIAVWHHAVAGPEQMKDVEFIGNLQKNGVKIALHGDVHEMRRDLIGYWHPKSLHIVGSGSFGARAEDRPEATPRLYNLLEISRDLKSACVHTRSQPKPDGPWKGWYEWPAPKRRKEQVAYYDIKL